MTATALPISDARPASVSLRPFAFAPLRAIVFKEIRECLKYVVFLQLLIALFIWQDLYSWHGANINNHLRNLDSILFLPEFQSSIYFICAVSALVLAFVQIFHERDFDRRSFLLHRPVSPTRIFLAKTFAGFFLYLLAAGIPLLVLFLFAAYSRYGGWLFDIHFTFPYLAVFFTGVPYYFAGVLIAQRQARLYAGKLIPLAGAIGGSIVGPFLASLPYVFFISGLLALIYGLTAWNGYLCNGLDSPLGQPSAKRVRRLIPRLCLPVVMILSLFTCTIPLALSGFNTLISWQDLKSEPAFWLTTGTTERSYTLLPDGRPGMRILHFHYPAEGGNDIIDSIEYFDLDGHPIPAFPDYPDATHRLIETGLPANLVIYANLFPRSDGCWKNSVELIADANNTSSLPANQRWYYLVGRRYFVRYDDNRHLVGTLGATGFLPADTPPQPFPDDPLLPRYVMLGNTIYQPQVSPHAALKPIVTLDEPDIIRFLGNSREGFWRNGEQAFALGDKKSYFFSYSDLQPSRPLLAFPLAQVPKPYYQWGHLRYYPKTHRVVAWNVRAGKVATLAEDGRLISQVQFPALGYRLPFYTDPPEPAEFFRLGLLHSFSTPLLTRPLHYYYYGVLQGANQWDDFSLPPASSLRGQFYFAGLFLPALLAAAAVYLLTRFYRFTPTGVLLWTFATFLLGPIGLLTLLFTQSFPARVPCPHCHKKCLITRDRCEYCGNPFPPPISTATEIFFPSSGTAAPAQLSTQ